MANEGPESSDLAADGVLVAFRSGAVWLAVPAQSVNEIVADTAQTRVPLAPPHIPGVITLHGKAIPLLDLTHFLNLKKQQEVDSEEGDEVDPADGLGNIIVVSAANMVVGLLCDQVQGVLEFDPGESHDLAVIRGEKLRDFSLAEVKLAKAVFAVLDLPKLLKAAKVAR